MNTPFQRLILLSLLIICVAHCKYERPGIILATVGMVPDETEMPPPLTKLESSILKPLTIKISNLRSADAPVVIGIYEDNKHFLKPEGRLVEYRFTPHATSLTVQISDQHYGEYAIAVYQDENNSGKMDRNMLGLPTEGWCLSNNFRPKYKTPTYQDCKFDYSNMANTFSLKMVW
jgi:uncharacterized protein (DUF2141 family)